MRHLLLGLSLTIGFLSQGTASAEETRSAVVGQVVSLQLLDAHRDYQAAKLRMHEYRFSTLPQHRRRLDQQSKLATAEIAVLHHRLEDYQPFLRVGDYSPVRTAAESHRLALIAAKQRLQQNKDDRVALLRHSRRQGQLYQLDVLQAATRMALAKQALAQSLEK